jgi:hypothetical protein
MRRRKVTVAVALSTVMLAGGVAYAATEYGNVVQSDGQIYACYGADGTMHVQENTGAGLADCPTGQKRMLWRQRGERGPTGPQGPQGPAYFARVLTTDNNTSKPAMTPIKTWNFTDGTIWLNVPQRDVRQCAVTATPVTGGGSATVIRASVPYSDWILLYTYGANGARAQFPVDVVLACYY